MSLKLKQSVIFALNLLLSVLTGFLVSEIYTPKWHWSIFAVACAITALAIVILTYFHTTDEEEIIELHKELEKKKFRDKIGLHAAVSDQLTREIVNGNLKKAQKWKSFKDNLG